MGEESGQELAKELLGTRTDAYIDRILKLMQIMYYGQVLGENDLTKKVVRNYRTVIDILGDKIETEVEDYQKVYGEI